MKYECNHVPPKQVTMFFYKNNEKVAKASLCYNCFWQFRSAVANTDVRSTYTRYSSKKKDHRRKL